MASIRISIMGAAGGAFGDLVTTFDFSDDDSDRILAFVMVEHGTALDGTARTPQQAATAMATRWFERLIAETRQHERTVAASAALATAAPALPYTTE